MRRGAAAAAAAADEARITFSFFCTFVKRSEIALPFKIPSLLYRLQKCWNGSASKKYLSFESLDQAAARTNSSWFPKPQKADLGAIFLGKAAPLRRKEGREELDGC